MPGEIIIEFTGGSVINIFTVPYMAKVKIKFRIFIENIPVIKMHKLYKDANNRDYINDFRTAD